jgi:choline dehydrogenase-like flavoprotein
MILESMQDQGLALQNDMFTSGNNPHGSGHVIRTHYKGDRTTSANYFRKKGSNLAIKTDTLVNKVVFEGEGDTLRAVAVRVVEKDGSTKELKARKEIIVSGGAYCSPTILMRSGIGPKSELQKHGLDCKVDLPGVGQNLMDHLVSCYLALLHIPADLLSRLSSSLITPQSQTSRTITFYTNQMHLAKHTDSGKKRNVEYFLHFHSEHSPTLVSMND